jgi:hypothetical protein
LDEKSAKELPRGTAAGAFKCNNKTAESDCGNSKKNPEHKTVIKHHVRGECAPIKVIFDGIRGPYLTAHTSLLWTRAIWPKKSPEGQVSTEEGTSHAPYTYPEVSLLRP